MKRGRDAAVTLRSYVARFTAISADNVDLPTAAPKSLNLSRAKLSTRAELSPIAEIVPPKESSDLDRVK